MDPRLQFKNMVREIETGQTGALTSAHIALLQGSATVLESAKRVLGDKIPNKKKIDVKK